MKNRIASIVVIAVIVLIVIAAFVVYSNPALSASLGLSHRSSRSNAAATLPRTYAPSGNAVYGSIESLNDDGFTITMQDGSTKNVLLTSTTTIQSFANASATPTIISADQLSVGAQVRVIGTLQSDGSISADRVQQIHAILTQ